MKKFFINLMRVVAQGVDLLLFEHIVILIFNCIDMGISLVTTAVFVFIALIPAVIIFDVLSRTPEFKDSASCKKAYPFIASRSFLDNCIFGWFSVALLVISFLLNYVQLNNYDVLYPNAAEVFTEEFHASETAQVLLKSVPTWCGEEAYYTAQLVHSYEEIKSDTQLSASETEDKLDELAAGLDTKTYELSQERLIGIVVILLFGLFQDMLTKSAIYHSYMRKFEEQEVK